MSFLIKRPDELARIRLEGSDSRVYKGGGGSREATAEEKQLWATQAASLQDQMDANAENRAITMPVFKSTLGWLDQESNKDFRGEANADFMQGLGQGLGATSRNLERFGSTMNPNALGAQMNNLALGTAAGRVGAMNTANDKQWDRKQSLFNGVQGMPMQTANAMGDVAKGVGSLSGQITNRNIAGMNADAQSAQGMGQMAMYAMKNGFGWADGGEVHLASGGPAAGVGLRGMTFSGSGGRKHGNDFTDTAGMLAGNYAMMKAPEMAGQIASKAMGQMGIGSYAGMGGTSAATGAAGDAVAAGLAKDAAFQGVTQGAGMSSAAGTGATMATEATAAAAGAAEAGTAAAGAGAAGSGALSAISTAMPYVGVGLGVNALLGDPLGLEKLFADGGSVPKEGLKRKDFRKKGGKVAGPGTPTSDSIPAWLSDGEYVVNATAMKDPKIAKTVKKANKKGLERRYGRKLADGGPAKKLLGHDPNGQPIYSHYDYDYEDEPAPAPKPKAQPKSRMDDLSGTIKSIFGLGGGGKRMDKNAQGYIEERNRALKVGE